MPEEVKNQDCDCLQKVAETIKAKVIEEGTSQQKGYNLVEGDWFQKSWYPRVRLYSVFLLSETHEKKDESTSKPKSRTMKIFYQYCPFCGNKYEEFA